MANTNLTIDWIGNEALRLAHEKARFIGTINRQFDESFQPGRGSAIRIRIPSQYVTRRGRVMDVQDGVQQSTVLAVASTYGVDLRYNSQEFAQDLVNFQKLHLEPAMATLISVVEADCIQAATQQTYNQVGVPGNAITSLTYPGLARARINQYLGPADARRIQLDSVTMSEIIPQLASYTNPREDISEQYREGMIKRTSMADWHENERVWRMAAGSDASTWISTYTLVEGDVDINVSSCTGAPTVGQTFTIGHTSTAGLYACHPETKQAYTHLQQFVVTAVSTVDGTNTSITFQPPIRISGARKNVCTATGGDIFASSFTSAIVRFEGGPSSTYAIPLMYYRDAYTFATAELPKYEDSIKCVTKTYDGISLRVWEGSDIRNDEKLTRIDILWGFAAIRPQWACRLIGTATS